MKESSAELWKSLSHPIEAPAPAASGYVHANGIKIYFAIHGSGEPLILLHGGLGNTDYWGSQIAAFASRYKVIVIASRGHGRSTRDEQPYSIHLMASDVLAVMDTLDIPSASLVGWSDGGTIGLDIAIHHSDRLKKLFAFGANFSPDGLLASADTDPVFCDYIAMATKDYERLSETPGEFDNFVTQISDMWSSNPKFTDEQLKNITTPVAVVVGEHDEIIARDHTEGLAQRIPGSELKILLGLSHFGLWQYPATFNKEVLNFLASR